MLRGPLELTYYSHNLTKNLPNRRTGSNSETVTFLGNSKLLMQGIYARNSEPRKFLNDGGGGNGGGDCGGGGIITAN